MDNIRKNAGRFVTVTAIVCTLGITAWLLCLPVKDAMRERNQKEVSLADDYSADKEERENAVDLNEEGLSKEYDMQMLIDKAAGVEEYSAAEQFNVSVDVSTNRGEARIKLWNTGEAFYFFLPAYAAALSENTQQEGDVKLILSSCLDGGSLMIGDKQLKEGDSLKDIQFEKLYSMSLYNQKGELVHETQVTFLVSENLPTMFINTESGSMEYIEEEKGNGETGDIIIYDNTGNLIHEGGLSEVSGRGNSTWGIDKKPYQIKLAQSADLFGFGKARSYNLLANGYDETGIRNMLVTNLAQELSMAYTPEGIIVSLYCNGEYRGNYHLFEKVQVGEERVNIKNQEEEFERVYQGIDVGKIQGEISENKLRKWADIDFLPADITGGYLIERELYERYETETISGFCTMQLDYYAIQSPEYASYEQVTYIADLMQAAQDAIEAPDGIHPETGKHYSEYIDVESFAAKYLVDEITKNYDGGVTSSFFYKPADEVDTRIFAGPIWDYDVAFGNCTLDEINSNPMGVTKLQDHVKGTDLFAQLYEKEDFKELAIKQYEEVVLPWLEKMYGSGVDEYAEYYRMSVLMNNIRWKNLHNRHEYYTSYDNNIRYLKYFMNERTDYLNEVWLEGEIYHCITLMVDNRLWKRIYVKDGECAGYLPLPRRTESVFIGWYKTGNPLIYDEYRPVYEDMTFHAQWQDITEYTISSE